MTDPQELTPDHVADLQKQLADAAAQVAKVQAELQTATGGPTPAPPATSAPSGAPAASSTTQTGPVVLIGGQQLANGQVDLDAMLGPQRAAQVRDAFSRLSQSSLFGPGTHLVHAQQLGLIAPPTAPGTYAQPPGSNVYGDDDSAGSQPDVGPADQPPYQPSDHAGRHRHHGGGAGQPGDPGSPGGVRLAEPPRPVPPAYFWGLFGFSMWEVFGIFMGGVAPIAIWIGYPPSIPAAFIAAILTIAFLRGRKDRTELALVKWGRVATVTNRDELSRGTYYSGTTVQNMVMAQAHGWDVTRQLYSGPVTVTKIDYTLGEYQGSFKLHGLDYDDGVILADSRNPERVMCVSQIPFSVKPDAAGNMTGALSVKQWIGIGFTLAIYTALIVGAVVTAYHFWIAGG